jgi:hypothetical protein
MYIDVNDEKTVVTIDRHRYSDTKEDYLLINFWHDTKRRLKNGRRLNCDALGELEITTKWLKEHPEFIKALTKPESIPLTDY